MEDNKKIDFATMFINEIERRKMKKLNKEKIFIDFNKSLCNNVLYRWLDRERWVEGCSVGDLL